MRSITVLAIVSAMTMGLQGAAAAQGRGNSFLYRWTDSKGVVHYTDQVPPEVSKQERAVLDHRGDVRRVLQAEKTPEQLAEEQRLRELEQKEREYDQFLLKSYGSVHDIESTRDSRLATIDIHLEQAQKAYDDVQSTLIQLRARSASAAARGASLDSDLERQIASYETAAADNHAAVRQLRDERVRTQQQFAHDIARFRELRGEH